MKRNPQPLEQFPIFKSPRRDLFGRMAEAVQRLRFDPVMLTTIKDEMVWEEAKELFIAEGRQSGLFSMFP